MLLRSPASGVKIAWWAAGGGLLVLFAAAHAAAIVPPERLWALQLLGLTVPALGVLMALVAAGAALARKWWLGGILSLALVIGTVGSSILASPPVSAPLPVSEASARSIAEPLRVMTFNANPARLRHQEAFPTLLDREDPHLVALQEFTVRLSRSTGNRSGHELIVPFLEGNRFGIAWPESDGDVLFQRPIFSKLESIEPVRVIPRNLGGGVAEGVWASGGITRGVYRWQGRPIAVYSVHLHSFGKERPWRGGWHRVLSPRAWRDALRTYRGDFKTRAEQARILQQMIDAEPHPFLVCGDLNSTPHNWVYTHLVRGRKDVFRVGGQGWGATFPARFPFFRIDYILASEEWVVRDARVLRSVTSDHSPLFAELELRPRSEPPTLGQRGAGEGTASR